MSTCDSEPYVCFNRPDISCYQTQKQFEMIPLVSGKEVAAGTVTGKETAKAEDQGAGRGRGHDQGSVIVGHTQGLEGQGLVVGTDVVVTSQRNGRKMERRGRRVERGRIQRKMFLMVIIYLHKRQMF